MIRNILNRLRTAPTAVKGGLSLLAATLFSFGLVAQAGAVVVPTGAETATTSGFQQLQDFATGTLGVALFAISIAIIAITMGVRWLRKGAHS